MRHGKHLLKNTSHDFGYAGWQTDFSRELVGGLATKPPKQLGLRFLLQSLMHDSF